MRPKVSLCMIVRDEADNLPDCLAGIGELFDEIIIVDTGSTDDTRKIAESFGAKVSEFPWCDDFSAARNVSRQRATGEWIFWHDADDRIDAENRAKLKAVIDSLPAAGEPGYDSIHVVTCRCGTCTPGVTFDIAHARLFRNDSDLRWRGRIHEYLVHGPEGRRVENHEYRFTDVTVHHAGYETQHTLAAKQCREQRILEQEYLLHPDDAGTPFYLGRLLAQQQKWSIAIPYLRRAIALDPTGQLSATPKAAVILLACLQESACRDEAAELASAFARRFHSNFEVQMRCGMLFRAIGRNPDAKACFRRSIDIMSSASSASVDQSRAGLIVGLDLLAARMGLAEIVYGEGDIDAAVAELRQVLVESPGCVRAQAMLGEISMRSGNLQQADATADALAALPDAQFEHALLRSMVAGRRGRHADAKRWARRAIDVRGAASAGWITLGQALEDEGADFDGCIAAYQQAYALYPQQTLQQRIDRVRLSASALRRQTRATTVVEQPAELVPVGAGWVTESPYAARPA